MGAAGSVGSTIGCVIDSKRNGCHIPSVVMAAANPGPSLSSPHFAFTNVYCHWSIIHWCRLKIIIYNAICMIKRSFRKAEHKLLSRFPADGNSSLRWILFWIPVCRKNHEESNTKLLLVVGHVKVFGNILEHFYCSKLQFFRKQTFQIKKVQTVRGF